jgi:serine/threonine protein kinase
MEETHTMEVMYSKGEFLGGGMSGMVELLDNGHVTKTPWPGERAEESQADLQLEHRVHLRLQERLAHADYTRRFVRLFSCDPADSTLTMEYMENGTLRDYLQAHPQQQQGVISQSQRWRWILALAEGVTMLHAHGILHCDLTPNNMLLSRTLELKIADFGCSSIDDSVSSGVAGARFNTCRDWRKPPSRDDDLFALGSSMYEILTGTSPLGDIASDQVRELHGLRQFADLTGLDSTMADVIRDCWLVRAQSAEAVYRRVVAAVSETGSTNSSTSTSQCPGLSLELRLAEEKVAVHPS